MNPRIEKLLKLPLYQRLIILLLLVALVTGGFAFLLYMPKQEELQNLQSRNAELQIKLQEDRRIAANLPKFKAEYEKMQEQLNQALTELPNQKEIPGLLTSIASLAKDHGLEVLRFKPGNEIPKDFYAEVPVELKLVGSYHEAAMFFDSVSNLSRIVNMNNVNLGAPKVNNGRVDLSIDFLATTFRFLENSQKDGRKK